jgi:hypothetical protein
VHVGLAERPVAILASSGPDQADVLVVADGLGWQAASLGDIPDVHGRFPPITERYSFQQLEGQAEKPRGALLTFQLLEGAYGVSDPDSGG